MQQDSLDDAHLLGFLRHLNETAIRVAAIVARGKLSPPLIGILIELVLIEVLVEHLDGAATHGNGNHTDFLIRECIHHCTSEIVGRAELTHWTDDRALRRIPVSKFTLGRIKITGCQHLETLIYVSHILSFPLGIALHVRLSETQVDIEVGVYLRICMRQHRCQHSTNHK